MFPDITNVEFIREALWRHKAAGNASIMIGAGFSRNADPVSGSARPMPNWVEMAKALCASLYPSDPARLDAALHEASGTSGFLRLAQEYHTAFGRSALNNKIRDLVPDLEYRPGDLYKRLLRLPWADIFSTNWDTLLERSCADVFERSYDVVRTVEQIPYARSPRIVKLHGTFPAHEPFIFTEEDYRTFPAQFAPFVNLVQQSMMETSFCLLGFSGDDPNFLHWSGWVRDNLTTSAPKIYLVGWLELSVHRRRMLEARNVMPVDLAALPQAPSWPPEFRHRYAAEWFIKALEIGKPYNASDWPSVEPPFASLPAHLGVVPSITRPVPQTEPHVPPFGTQKAERLIALRKALQTWAHNRRLYPGWMIAPEHIRRALWTYTTPWVPEIAALLDDLTPLDQLQALSELVWRLNKCLFPLPSNFEEAAFRALAAVDHLAMRIGTVAFPSDGDWHDLLCGFQELALALSRNARHSGDLPRFERAVCFLSPLALHSTDTRHAMAYERCLWTLAAGDLQTLKAMLDDWSPGDGEAIWLLRKAGLLAEMREDHRACAALEAALMQIRRTRRRDIDDIVCLSRESWALFLALAYSGRQSIVWGPELPDDMPEPFQRWRDLAAVECDANGEYRALVRILELGRQPAQPVTRQKSFDVDRDVVTYHIASGPSQSVIAAYEMMLLAEETGIPGATSHLVLFRDGLSAAAKILVADEPWLASQVAIRVEPAGSDKLIDNVFSRALIAALPDRLVSLLRDGMSKRLTYGLAVLGTTGASTHDWVNICAGAIEILSRVALRLPPSELKALFNEAIAYYRSPVMRRRSIFLGTALSNLLARTLESLPDDQIEPLLPTLFALPLVHEPGFEADQRRWIEPVAVLRDDFRPVESTQLFKNPAWAGIIARLSEAAIESDIPNREAALFRLYKLWNWHLLNDSETALFARALWAPGHLSEDGLPSHTKFYAWAYLTLPTVEDANPLVALARYLKRVAERGDDDIYIQLQIIGNLISEAERLGVQLDVDASTQQAFTELVDAWASKRLSSRLSGLFGGEEEQREMNALIDIKVLLPRIERSESLFRRIWDKVDDLDSHGDRAVRAYALYGVLTRLFPVRAGMLADRLRRALASDVENDGRIAVRALYEWTRDAMRAPNQFVIPNEALFREIGIAIAARRTAILRTALEIARWLFDDGPERLAAQLAADSEYGLGALLEEASYARASAPFDVPGIRAACVRLAHAMARAGFGTGPGVQAWIAAAKDDPLPEVRHALSRKFDE